jgi:nucleoside-diphosphate-sugar epimerase
MSRVLLVTGASGFVGSAILARLAAEAAADGNASRPVGLVRRPPAAALAGVEYRVVADLQDEAAVARAIGDADAIVHAAARVHMMRDGSTDPLAEFRKVNRDATASLARTAARRGVRRLVYLSSIKVLGESTPAGRRFAADDAPDPRDPYGVSKLEAEVELQRIASATALEVVVVRPPLVYGPGVKANFLQLMRAIGRGMPLPLGAVRNARSLVALDNLVDFVLVCVDHPAAAGQAFNVTDGEDLSTPELARRIGIALGRKAVLLPVPPALLQAAAALVGRHAAVARLCGSLEVDIAKSRSLLGWRPVIGVGEALARTAAAYLAGCRGRSEIAAGTAIAL